MQRDVVASEVFGDRGPANVTAPSPSGKMALQGLPPELALLMSKQTLLRGTGNSFTVSVVAAVFRQCLVAIALRRSPITGALAMTCSLHRPLEQMQ